MEDEISAKQRVLNAIKQLPDDASIEDILYTVYVIQRIEAGLADIKAGRTIPHEEVVQSIKKWLEPRDEASNA